MAIIITPGEPAGVGPELLLKVAAHGKDNLVTMDDPERLAGLAEKGGINLRLQRLDPDLPLPALAPGTLGVIPLEWARPIVFGQPDAGNAQQIIKAIDDAVVLLKAGKAKALVTNPIHKATLYQAGFSCPGHTEYLAARDGKDIVPVMMLANERLRVTPLTVHLPLKQIFAHITADNILRALRIMNLALIRDMSITRPRIAVAGLNPHAGESGTLGHEDNEIIKPAIKAATDEGIAATGPYPADSLFHEEKHRDYDAVLAMYHDQALIPVKTLDFHHSVNITLGLSFIRTSPDHGTALDQAGRFTARPDSLARAIDMAGQMAATRS